MKTRKQTMKQTIKQAIATGAMGLLLGISFAQQIDTATSTQNADNFDVQNAVQNITELKDSVNNITAELFKLDKQQEGSTTGNEAKYKETRDEIVKIISTINNTTEEVGKRLRQVTVYQKAIFDAGSELKQSRLGVEETKNYISDFANFIYKLSNNLYDKDTNTIDEIKLLVNSDNVPRTLANDFIIQSMINQLNDLIKSFDDNQGQQIENLKKYGNLKSQAERDLTEYQNDIEKLQQKKNYLMQFLTLYKKDATQRKISMNNLFESNKSVYEKIEQLVKETKKGIYKGNSDIETKLKNIATDEVDNQHPVAWPIYPIKDIQTYFADETFQKTYGIPHLGIQITSYQGNPVYAARDGVVNFVADNDDIGINWTMIVHTDGYVTAYEYLNKTVVQEGDTVKRGQLIGFSGGEPGTRGAGFISKGPNLTFMVFKDGIAIDPFDILDASIVQDKDVLPDGYQIKYLRDKYARPIDITNLKLMTGESQMQREIQFLTTYGVGVYRNVAFWDDVVKETNIDRDVVMCIAFAESTLGRYLSTSNNIGNVGNNDRGDRIGFMSAYAGARSIPLTLNNGFLGKYHTINQLSRYGNKDGKIYASSPINWQTNVLKCLSQVKGYYIPEDFPFRTGTNPNLEKKSDTPSETATLIEQIKKNTIKK